MTMVRVWEVLEASETARSAYLHIHSQLNLRPMAKNAICLLLWLETAMGFDILQSITAMSPDNISLTRVVYEANAMYTFVLFGYYSMPPAFQGIDVIISLCNDAGGHRLVDFRFFMFHKELVARGVSMIRDTVARVVFDENLHVMLRRFEDDLANSFLQIPNPVPAPELMAPFVASTRTPCEDSRTAFIALPIGHTLISEDIKNYFERTMQFGPCIEHVAMERESVGEPPKHGVIVFRSRRLRNQAMFGDYAAFFRVDGHHMWVQRYRPLY